MALLQGQRSNFNNLKFIGPYVSIHQEPSEQELLEGKQQAIKIRDIFLSTTYVHDFTKKIFCYRIDKSDSLIQNLYDFFVILLKKPIQLYYSPHFGFALWVFDLGFCRYDPICNILEKNTYVYFEDYITETTSFIRYHYDFRYNFIFKDEFRKQFICLVIQDLLKFSASLGRKDLMASCIECALNTIFMKSYS